MYCLTDNIILRLPCARSNWVELGVEHNTHYVFKFTAQYVQLKNMRERFYGFMSQRVHTLYVPQRHTTLPPHISGSGCDTLPEWTWCDLCDKMDVYRITSTRTPQCYTTLMPSIHHIHSYYIPQFYSTLRYHSLLPSSLIPFPYSSLTVWQSDDLCNIKSYSSFISL